MLEPETEGSSPVLQEAARELQAAEHDAQVAFDCIALGEIDRAHTHALTARVAVDAALTALAEALTHENLTHEDLTQENLTHEGRTHENLTQEGRTAGY